jgi:4-amino-4-deoxy-L-arabinose transferase-like glycosyltransferase
MASDARTSRPLPRWAELTLLLLILALAATFRFYQFGEIPPGPHYDEASIVFDALDVLAGKHTPFSLRPYGREMLHVYLALPLVLLLGPTHLALRLLAALTGILTSLAIYLFVLELLGKRDRGMAQWTGLLAALLFSVSYWALAVNRIGFRANYVPLLETLCFLFFWRALRTNRWWEYALSGLFLGLALNTYISSRFVPGVLLVFVASWALTREGRSQILRRWHGWLSLILTALLLFAPLLVFFLTHPGTFVMRASGVSLTNPSLNQGNVWGLLARSVLGNLGLFGFAGDPDWVFNIPGRPATDVVPAVFFWIGVLLCLLRWRKQRYAFLLLWWAIMLLPGILAPDPIPHSLRTFGALPAACIIASVAATGLLSFAARRLRPLRGAVLAAGTTGLLVAVGWTGYTTWHDYFYDWAQRDEVYYAYYGHMADLAQQINHDTHPDTVYVFPVNYDRRGDTYHEYTLELLHRGPTPFHYIIVDDATVAGDLTDICAGKTRVQLVVWTHGEHVDADPRRVLPSLLTRFGRRIQAKAFQGYRIITYELPSRAVNFAEPPDFSSMSATFGDRLELVAQAHSEVTPSGETAWVTLRWQARQAMEQDYKVSLRLVDASGHRIGQADTQLLSNQHRTTSHWQPGQVVTTYHRLSSLPATLPGEYWLHLTVYDSETRRPLAPVDEGGTNIGEQLVLDSLEVSRPWRLGVVEPAVPLGPIRLAPDLEVLGYDLDRERFNPGETIHLAVYWRALEEIGVDYTLVCQLLAGGEAVAVEWRQAPDYATSQWRAGDLWRDWHDLRIAPEVAAGDYQLVVRLANAEAAESLPATLAVIEIQGRPRLFEVPDIDHPQATQLGMGIQLLGYDLPESQARAGEVLHLTLYWQALQQSDQSYTVFTHLLDGNARIWGQKDSVPGGGALPTTGWMVGEVIVDDYEIVVNPEAPTGEYLLEIGMYDAATDQRLPISDQAGSVLGDHIILDTPILVIQ